MNELSKAEEREYAELADRAEHGELKPTGRALHGEAAAAEARETILAATGASTVEEATRIALGRPRLGEQDRETKIWKVRTTSALDETVRAAAKRRGVSVSEYIRLAAAHQVEADTAASA